MARVYKILGLIWAVLSLVRLILYGLREHSLAGPFAAILSFFETVIEAILYPFEPLAHLAVAALQRVLSVDLQLGDHWRYMMCLIMLYVGAQIKHAWSAGFHGFALFRLASGLLVALLGSAFLGLLDFDNPTTPLYGPLFIGTFFAAYQVFNSIWIFSQWRDEDLDLLWPGFVFSYAYPVYFLLIGFASFLFSFALMQFSDFSNRFLSVTAMLIFIILLTSFWFFMSGWRPAILRRRGYRPPQGKDGPFILAFSMTSVLLGAMVFLVANAGWVLVFES